MPSRAEKELIADAARSNRLIASLIGCDHHVIARARARLEATGEIAPAPIRTPRYPNGPRSLGRAQQAVADLGPLCTTRQVMELSGVGRGAAWKARTHPRTLPDQLSSGELTAPLPDLAAATDALTVERRAGSRLRTGSTLPAGFYRPADAIERVCPACTLAYRDGGWQHDRACILRGS
jgi:hypothetical protein